jgi:hypothetical protein
MTRYLISFDDGAMTFPEEELPDVAEAAHKVVQEAKNAGVWVFGGGVASQSASVVATDGTVTAGAYPETKAVIGGFSVVDVPSREEAGPPRSPPPADVHKRYGNSCPTQTSDRSPTAAGSCLPASTTRSKRPVRLSHKPAASQDTACQGPAGQASASPSRATVGPPHSVTLVRAGRQTRAGEPLEVGVVDDDEGVQ